MSHHLLNVCIARYQPREGGTVHVSLTWGPGRAHAHLDRWQVRVLERWAEADAAADTEAAATAERAVSRARH